MAKRGLSLVFLAAVVSGVSIFINKFGVAGMNSSVYTFLKNAIVAVFLLSFVVLLAELKTLASLSRKQWLLLLATGLVGGSIPFLLYFKGLQLTSSSSASFFHKTMFVYVLIMAGFFLKERIDKKILLSALLILFGNALFLKFNPFNLSTGDFLIITATVFWACESVISKYLLKSVGSSVVAFGRMFFGSIFILVFLAVTKQLVLVAQLTTGQTYWILITSGFLLLYVWFWYNGLRSIEVTTATAILLVGSLITSGLDYFFSGITLTASQSFGVLLLLAGIIGLVGYSHLLKSTKIFLEKCQTKMGLN